MHLVQGCRESTRYQPFIATFTCALTVLTVGLIGGPRDAAQAATPPRAGGPSTVSVPFDPGFEPETYWTPGRQARAIVNTARAQSRSERRAKATHPVGPMPRPEREASWEFDGWPSIGRFFANVGGTDRFCTGAVVNSHSRSVVVSAAHCFGGDVRNVTFAPRSDNGVNPYGLWRVRWLTRHSGFPNHQLDYAFATIERRGGQRIEDVTTGIFLAANRGRHFGGDSLLIGYPNSRSRPLACWSTIVPGPYNSLQIACDNFTGGTSGSPFLAREGNRHVMVGVIGGYQNGGSTADISYSSYFDSRTEGVLMAADVRGL